MLIWASAVKRLAINEAAAAKSPEQWPPITRINHESKLVVFCHPSYNGTGPHGSLYQVEKLDVFILHGSTELACNVLTASHSEFCSRNCHVVSCGKLGPSEKGALIWEHAPCCPGGVLCPGST
jgi:hypothetical protein